MCRLSLVGFNSRSGAASAEYHNDAYIIWVITDERDTEHIELISRMEEANLLT